MVSTLRRMILLTKEKLSVDWKFSIQDKGVPMSASEFKSSQVKKVLPNSHNSQEYFSILFHFL